MTPSPTGPGPVSLAVVVPLFRAGRYLDELTAELRAQLRPGDELHLVDDGCPEGGYAAFADAVPGRTVLHRQERNGGVSSARNLGIAAGGTTHVTFIDADDLPGPGQLDRVRRALAGDGAADVVVVPARGVDAEGRDAPELRRPNLWPDVLEGLLQGPGISTSQLTVSRRALVDVGMFDPFVRYCEDWDLALRLAARGWRFVELGEEAAVRYRRHDAQASLDLRRIAAGTEAVLRRAATYVPEAGPYRKLVREGLWDVRLFRHERAGGGGVLGAMAAGRRGLRRRFTTLRRAAGAARSPRTAGGAA